MACRRDCHASLSLLHTGSVCMQVDPHIAIIASFANLMRMRAYVRSFSIKRDLAIYRNGLFIFPFLGTRLDNEPQG